jgi:hypothetical protein
MEECRVNVQMQGAPPHAHTHTHTHIRSRCLPLLPCPTPLHNGAGALPAMPAAGMRSWEKVPAR